MAESEQFQAGWNLATSIIGNIGGYLTTGGTNFLQGNLDKYYWYMYLIKRRIYAWITAEEKNKTDALEVEIESLLPKFRMHPLVPEKELIKKLKEYDGEIICLLHKYKLLVPPKLDRTVLMA